MPRSGAETVDQQSTKERILKAASELFAEQGFSAASISKIAKRASVLPGSLYWAFESKEKLFAAVIDQQFDVWRNEFVPYLGQGGVESDEWGELFVRAARGVRQQPEFLRLLMVVATERQAGDPAILDSANRIRRQGKKLIGDIVLKSHKGGDSQEARRLAERMGRLWLQLLDGIFMSLQLEGEELDAEAMFQEAAAVVDRELEAGLAELQRSAADPS